MEAEDAVVATLDLRSSKGCSLTRFVVFSSLKQVQLLTDGRSRIGLLIPSRAVDAEDFDQVHNHGIYDPSPRNDSDERHKNSQH